MANKGVGLAIHRSWVKFPAVLLSYNNLGQSCSHTHVPLSPSSIIWYRSRSGDTLRLGSNRKSGVALAMRHMLQWFIIIIIPGIYTTWGKNNNNNNNNKQISIAP